jgi:biotin carboxyl carrier protein
VIPAEVTVNGRKVSIERKAGNGGKVELLVNGKPVVVEILSRFGHDSSAQLLRINSRLLLCKVGGRVSEHSVVAWINDKEILVELSTDQEKNDKRTSIIHAGQLLVDSPMAGRIIEVYASSGSDVQEGQPLLILEAMKMENEIAAPRNGRVREIYVHVGSVVKTGDKLLVLD